MYTYHGMHSSFRIGISQDRCYGDFDLRLEERDTVQLLFSFKKYRRDQHDRKRQYINQYKNRVLVGKDGQQRCWPFLLLDIHSPWLVSSPTTTRILPWTATGGRRSFHTSHGYIEPTYLCDASNPSRNKNGDKRLNWPMRW